MVTTDNLKSYFDKARRFDQDRMIQIERSNRIAWSIAIASGIVAGVSVFAIAGLTPSRRWNPSWCALTIRRVLSMSCRR